MNQKTLHLVFQTHWDREWYFPFETFRVRLVSVIDRIIAALEANEIACFVLDGQTLPILDYLEVASKEQKEAFTRFVQSGQIIVGPWFIAMDEFLVQGESIIRNLEIGEQIASQFGQNQRFGYLPDTFGHIGQMPQILKQFDIEDAMMWRGINLEESEFIWEGLDGSQLFTIYLTEGYYQPLVNQQNFQTDTQTYIQKIASKAKSSHLLLTAGGDHLTPINQNLAARIEALQHALPEMKFQVNDYLGYVQVVKAEIDSSTLPILKGELNSNQKSYILPNVWSTRSYLKITNQQLEDRLLYQIEPLMAYTYLFQKGAPKELLQHIWKTVLENQPHDSICGCSVDAVHQENEMRSLKAFQMIDSLQAKVLHDGAFRSLWFYQNTIPSIESDDSTFSIFNPHLTPFSGIVKGTLFLHQHHALEAFELVTETNEIIPVHIKSIQSDRLFESPLDYPPFFRPGKRMDVEFYVKNIPPFSAQVLKIQALTQKQQSSKEQSTLENEFYEISVNANGSLRIKHKQSGVIYDQWNLLYSGLDAGDSYNYSKPVHDQFSFPKLIVPLSITHSAVAQTAKLTLSLLQPKGLRLDRQGPSHELVETKIEMEITLYPHNPMIHVVAWIDQLAQDQRLRVTFATKTLVKESISDSAFELSHRLANRKEEYDAPRQKEVAVAVDHSLSMIHLQDDAHTLQFFHRGLHEYQTIHKGDYTSLEVTLIRSVSHLSRDDFRSRGGAAGPNLATPDAQVNRKMKLEYAFAIEGANTSPESSMKAALAYRNPAFIMKGANPAFKKSLIGSTNPDIFCSSTRIVNEKCLEVRLWNPKNEILTTELTSDYDILSIERVQINHKFITKTSNQITLHPHQIQTLLITFP